MTAARAAASIHARLLNGANARRENFNITLARYAIERFLYRISVSEVRDQFVLKGALLFGLWFDAPHRPTRDADFLGFGEIDASALTETIRAMCAIPVDDGMTYDPSTVTTTGVSPAASRAAISSAGSSIPCDAMNVGDPAKTGRPSPTRCGS